MSVSSSKLFGAGMGFRRELVPALKALDSVAVDFFEIAPENWLGIGGRFARDLRMFTERFPFVCHGLSLSLGGTDPLDRALLENIKNFIREHNIILYTEHLSWCTDDGHLYDLLPIPCTEEAVRWVSDRIKQTQDILEMQVGIENASYYFSPPGAEMKEEEFINAVVQESGCFLHLDVNNIYVNSQNFGFDPVDYLEVLPLNKVGYMHVAGHFKEEDGIIVDTHGAAVVDPVWHLLDLAYHHVLSPNIPTCLERDFNFPGLHELLDEVNTIRSYQKTHISYRQQRDKTHG
jgi:uncharacterized protein (UPF0276 family)